MACPICKKPTTPEFKPFCSKRCADVDLSRWMKGAYVVPGRDGEAFGRPDPNDEEDET